jgi:phosphoribosylamine--glycine ligase
MNILVLGGGGREHAIIRKLNEDGARIKELFCAPGNPGTDLLATNILINPSEPREVLGVVERHQIDLVVVGPEDPLDKCIIDILRYKNIAAIGPTVGAAKLETSKFFARDLMTKIGVAQPEYLLIDNEHAAQRWKELRGLPLVLKANGLAAGKGVFVCQTEEEWADGIKAIFRDGKFGKAAEQVLMEEYLEGEELSCFFLCDGTTARFIGAAQDHKRLLNDDEGPNTGGMGAYSPTPLLTADLLAQISGEIVEPVLAEMASNGHPFTGFLYVSIMVVEGQPYVIEFNVRLGDPEAQVILPLMKSSLLDLLIKTTQGKLHEAPEVEFHNQYAVCVVKAAEGYPESYPKNMIITGLDKETDTRLIFQAGTQQQANQVVSSGGRVLGLVGIAETLPQAISEVYEFVDLVSFEKEYYRTDIAQKGIAYLKENNI